jgi:hypothetical protein
MRQLSVYKALACLPATCDWGTAAPGPRGWRPCLEAALLARDPDQHPEILGRGPAQRDRQPTTLRDNTSGEVLHGAGVIDAARRLIVAGHSVDLGAWQINSRNLSLLDLGVADAFEPCKAAAPTGTADLGLMPPAYPRGTRVRGCYGGSKKDNIPQKCSTSGCGGRAAFERRRSRHATLTTDLRPGFARGAPPRRAQPARGCAASRCQPILCLPRRTRFARPAAELDGRIRRGPRLRTYRRIPAGSASFKPIDNPS